MEESHLKIQPGETALMQRPWVLWKCQGGQKAGIILQLLADGTSLQATMSTLSCLSGQWEHIAKEETSFQFSCMPSVCEKG